MAFGDENDPYLLPEMEVLSNPQVDDEEERKKRELIARIAAQLRAEQGGVGVDKGTPSTLTEPGSVFEQYNVSPKDYTFDPTTDTIRRRTSPDGASANEPATPIDTTPSYSRQFPMEPGADISEAEQIATQPSLSDQVEKLTRSTRLLGRGALSTVAQTPYNLAAVLAAVPTTILEQSGAPKLAGVGKSAIDWLLDRSAGAGRFAGELTGTGPGYEAENAGEKLAQLTGESLVPYGKHTATLTAAATGGHLLTNNFITPAAAATAKERRAQEAAQKKVQKQDQMQEGVNKVIDTVGGQAEVKHGDYKTLGYLGLATMGMIFGPKLYGLFKNTNLPKLRPVENAAPGTMALSSNMDLARTYDDVNAGAIRIARKAGIDPDTVKRLSDLFQGQTRTTTNALVEGAIQAGKMDVPAFTFQSKVPLAKLAQKDSQQVRDYLHLHDTFDDLLLQKVKPGTTAGPVRVRGLTEQDVLQQIGALERANPELREIGKLYKDNVKSVRAFLSKGEYATLTPSQHRHLNAQRASTVPFQGKRVTGEPVERGSPFEAQATYMHAALRKRMENEAVGAYVDNMRKVVPESFVRVTPEQLKANPNWRRNTVTIHRRGKPEHYTTDQYLADVLRMDPYYITSNSGQLMYASKRLLETGSTGLLAPWFSVTSMIRSWRISKFTAGMGTGRNSATILGSFYAIPQQLIPQLSKAIGSSLERGSGGWLGAVLGQGNVNALSTRLTKAYNDSLVAQMQTVGTSRGSILEQQVSAQGRLQTAIDTASATIKPMLQGYKAILHAVHNAPMHNFAVRNTRGTIVQRMMNRSPNMPLPDVAREARHLTGDPHTGGRYRTKPPAGDAYPIRMENPPNLNIPRTNVEIPGSGRVTHTLTKGYGRVSEFGREAIPWFNITEQGVKRIGEAYINNPVAFTAKLWTYSMMPAATSYLSAKALGNDPNGVSYVDYMMNRRSEYQKLMNDYFPIPGRPAEEGIEFPRFHEVAGAAHMMTIALDHLFRSSINPETEDFKRAASAFLDAAVIPPNMPIINFGMATQGMIGPQGVYGGEAYRHRQDPFDQYGGLPSNIELMARALGGGIADVIGAGAASYTQTPEGVITGLKNSVTESGKRMIAKTPIIRDLTNTRAPMTGNNQVTEELFRKHRKVEELAKFLQKADGVINVKPASVAGGEIAKGLLGKTIPTQAPGLTPKEPINPLYYQFAEMVRQRIKSDVPDKGGIGMRSLWRRYGDATEALRTLRRVNDGNNVTWQKRLEDQPEQLAYLKENNIDPTNLTMVRNFYERNRQDAARTLLFAIRSVENEMTQTLGQQVRFEDLNPYGKGLEPPEKGADPYIQPPWFEPTTAAP